MVDAQTELYEVNTKVSRDQVQFTPSDQELMYPLSSAAHLYHLLARHPNTTSR